MAKKRKSGGRSLGKKGRAPLVQCTACGRLVPEDKAKKFTVYSSAVDWRLARELQDEGAYIPKQKKVVYYCVSCAIHRGKVHIRKREERKKRR